MLPCLCSGAEDAPPEADVLLTFGTAATVAADGGSLAARSGYFRALLAWPTGHASASGGEDPLRIVHPGGASDLVSGAGRGAVGGDDRDRSPETVSGDGDGDGDASASDAVRGDDDADREEQEERDDAHKDGDGGRALRVVALPGTDPNAALLALRALYGLPWTGCFAEVVDVFELLDAWDACPDARARCLTILRQTLGDRCADSRVMSALRRMAWGTDPRPLSDALRTELLSLTARGGPVLLDWTADEWPRTSAAVAAAFLARHDLVASEEDVLAAALRWMRAAPRSDDDVAAVSRSVRYGALHGQRLAALWVESDVPAAMLVDARHLLERARGCGLDGADPVATEVAVRCMPRRPGTEPQQGRMWRVSCAVEGHLECFVWTVPLTDLRAFDDEAQYSREVWGPYLSFASELHRDKATGDHVWVLDVQEVKTDIGLVLAVPSAHWVRTLEAGESLKLRATLSRANNQLAQGRGDALPMFAIHTTRPRRPTQ